MSDLVNLWNAFTRCITLSNGGKSIDCRRGLWGVSSNCPNRTEKEAFYYWKQYFRDGEYDSLLADNKTTNQN
jgi:hypothetical protein